MASGYMITIEDGKGNTKKFYSDKARTHGQGNSVASGIIESFTARFPEFGHFSTRNVAPSNGSSEAVDVKGNRYGELEWP